MTPQGLRQRPQMTVITWNDNGSTDDTDLLSWESPVLAMDTPKVVTSVGWLLREGDEGITIANHFGASEEEGVAMYSNARVIPWDAIIERWDLTLRDQDDEGKADGEEDETHTEEQRYIGVGDCPQCGQDDMELYALGEWESCEGCLAHAQSGAEYLLEKREGGAT